MRFYPTGLLRAQRGRLSLELLLVLLSAVLAVVGLLVGFRGALRESIAALSDCGIVAALSTSAPLGGCRTAGTSSGAPSRGARTLALDPALARSAFGDVIASVDGTADPRSRSFGTGGPVAPGADGAEPSKSDLVRTGKNFSASKSVPGGAREAESGDAVEERGGLLRWLGLGFVANSPKYRAWLRVGRFAPALAGLAGLAPALRNPAVLAAAALGGYWWWRSVADAPRASAEPEVVRIEYRVEQVGGKDVVAFTYHLSDGTTATSPPASFTPETWLRQQLGARKLKKEELGQLVPSWLVAAAATDYWDAAVHTAAGIGPSGGPAWVDVWMAQVAAANGEGTSALGPHVATRLAFATVDRRIIESLSASGAGEDNLRLLNRSRLGLVQGITDKAQANVATRELLGAAIRHRAGLLNRLGQLLLDDPALTEAYRAEVRTRGGMMHQDNTREDDIQKWFLGQPADPQTFARLVLRAPPETPFQRLQDAARQARDELEVSPSEHVVQAFADAVGRHFAQQIWPLSSELNSGLERIGVAPVVTPDDLKHLAPAAPDSPADAALMRQIAANPELAAAARAAAGIDAANATGEERQRLMRWFRRESSAVTPEVLAEQITYRAEDREVRARLDPRVFEVMRSFPGVSVRGSLGSAAASPRFSGDLAALRRAFEKTPGVRLRTDRPNSAETGRATPRTAATPRNERNATR